MDQFEHFLRRALKIPPKELFAADFLDHANGLFYDTYFESPLWQLEKFCLDVKNKRPISEETLEWLADAGRKYLEGKSTLALALGVEKPKRRGRPGEFKVILAGLRMFALVHCENEKYEVALLQVMEQSKISERNIKRAYAGWRDQGKGLMWGQKDE